MNRSLRPFPPTQPSASKAERSGAVGPAPRAGAWRERVGRPGLKVAPRMAAPSLCALGGSLLSLASVSAIRSVGPKGVGWRHPALLCTQG